MKVNTLIKYYRGTSDKLPNELMEGTIYYITDENKFYIDIDSRRSVLDAEKANYLVKGQVAISLDDLYLKQEIDDKIALNTLRWEPYDEDGDSEDDNEIKELITLKTGIPLGGKEGQVLAKTSNDNYDVAWRTIEVSSGPQSQIWISGTEAPINTKVLWIDTTPNTGGLKYYDGSEWVYVPIMMRYDQ